MIFTKVEDLKYSSADNSTIDLFATCEELGRIPMTLNMVDTEDYHSYKDSKSNVMPLEAFCKTHTIASYVKPEVITIIPSKITMRQFRLYLLKTNRLDEVEVVANGSASLKIEWEYSAEITRTNNLIIEIKESLGLSEENINKLFLEASKL